MVNCWFGLVVWIPGIPENERDWDSWLYPDSNPKPLNAPNQQLTITRWWFQIFFIFTPTWGRFPILTNIFQMGWNHQPVNHQLRIPENNGYPLLQPPNCMAPRFAPKQQFHVGSFLGLFFGGRLGREGFFFFRRMWKCHVFLGGGFKYFLFSSLFGEMIQVD